MYADEQKNIVRADDMKIPIPLHDFKAFLEAIKEARKKRDESRSKVSSDRYISPRCLDNIVNKGQRPSLQVFYDLVTRYDIFVEQFSFQSSLLSYRRQGALCPKNNRA